MILFQCHISLCLPVQQPVLLHVDWMDIGFYLFYDFVCGVFFLDLFLFLKLDWFREAVRPREWVLALKDCRKLSWFPSQANGVSLSPSTGITHITVLYQRTLAKGSELLKQHNISCFVQNVPKFLFDAPRNWQPFSSDASYFKQPCLQCREEKVQNHQ